MNDKESQAFLFWLTNVPPPKTQEGRDKMLQLVKAQCKTMDDEQLEKVVIIGELHASALESELSRRKKDRTRNHL